MHRQGFSTVTEGIASFPAQLRQQRLVALAEQAVRVNQAEYL